MMAVAGTPLAPQTHDPDSISHLRSEESLSSGSPPATEGGKSLFGTSDGHEAAKLKYQSVVRAASCGDVGAVREFLFAGSNVNSKDDYGWNALSRASFKGHLPCVEFLLAQGAFADSEDREGNTAIFWAAMFDRTTIIEALLKAGCNVNHQSRDGSLPIHVAARWQRESAAILLAECGADIEEVDGEGRSALQYAEYERLKLALEDGAYRFESHGGPKIKPVAKERCFCCTS